MFFDKVTKEPLVVIDLDTIMPGMSMYDFCDTVRFIANTSAEDEPTPAKSSWIPESFVRLQKDLSGKPKTF
ncbi:MAG: hypothetical protein ACLR2E_02800 [Lachnospiraceae bacterium]